MSYTAAPEDGPSWMNRLPRISSQSRSQARTMSDTDIDDLKLPEFPPGTLPPVGLPGNFLRRVKEEEQPSRQGSRASSLAGRRKRKKWDDGIGPGGPIAQSAIFPTRRSHSDITGTTLHVDTSRRSLPDRQDSGLLSPLDAARRGRRREREDERKSEEDEKATPPEGEAEAPVQVYDEGDNIVIENAEGDVLAVRPTDPEGGAAEKPEEIKEKIKQDVASSNWSYDALKRKFGNWRNEEIQKRKNRDKGDRKSEPARAYQFGNTIIVEDEDGEVVKKYELPPQRQDGGDLVAQSLKYMGMGGLVKKDEKPDVGTEEVDEGEPSGLSRVTSRAGIPSWANFNRPAGEASAPRNRKKSVAEVAEEEDDRHIRFTIGGVGQRMTKEDFIREMQKLDQTTRRDIVDQSSASHIVKRLATQDPPEVGTESPSRGKERASSPRRHGHDAEASDITSDVSSFTDRGGRHRSPSESVSPGQSPVRFTGESSGASDEPETAVERRRRLAVLRSVGDEGEGDTRETPAERRRREAALGMASPAADSDSEDDDTPRVPPARRGIRFADAPTKGA